MPELGRALGEVDKYLTLPALLECAHSGSL